MSQSSAVPFHNSNYTICYAFAWDLDDIIRIAIELMQHTKDDIKGNTTKTKTVNSIVHWAHSFAIVERAAHQC